MGETYTPIPGYETAGYTESQVINISSDRKIGDMGTQVSIQGEANSQYIVYEMDRYHDGVDLSDKLIQIHYERRDGLGDNSTPVNVCMSDSRIRFGWVVPGRAAALDGTLKVMPFATGLSPMGETYIIKSLYAEYTVHKGLSVNEGIEEPDEEWYQAFVSRIAEYTETAKGYAGLAAEYEKNAMGYRDQAAQIASAAKSDIETQVEAGIRAVGDREGEALTNISDAESVVSGILQDAQDVKDGVTGLLGETESAREAAVSAEAGAETARADAEAAESGAEAARAGAGDSAAMAKSYAVGGTGTREGEDDDNARAYCDKARRMTETMVSGVKGAAEGKYRTGDVEITPENIGLGNVPNVSTNDQTPTFTEALGRVNILSGEKLHIILGKIKKIFSDIKIVAFTASYHDLDDTPTIPTVPSSLKNPHALTFTGGVTGTYDGSAAKSVAIPTSLPANGGNAATVGGKSAAELQNYNNLTNKPGLFSGNYNDLTNKPTIPSIPASLPANGGNADTVDGKHASDLQNYNNLSNKPTIPTVPTSLPANGGNADTASQVSGTYTGSGGQQSPSYVTSGKTRFNMWNAFKGITNPAGGYMDVILMDNYTGGDVPYVTGIGVTKNNGNPRMFIANGAKGGTGNWAHQVEVMTTANMPESKVITATIPAANWSGAAAPYTNTVSVAGVTASSIVDVSLSSSATQAQYKAFSGAGLADGGQAAGSITLKAYGEKPAVDIPVKIIVRGDA